jgi:hypothetical protein
MRTARMRRARFDRNGVHTTADATRTGDAGEALCALEKSASASIARLPIHINPNDGHRDATENADMCQGVSNG